MDPISLLVISMAFAAVAEAAEAPEETPAAVRLSLGEAVSRARASSPRLAQLSSLESYAEAAVRGARAARMPRLDLVASYTRSSNVPELFLALPGAPSRPIFPNIPDSYRTGAGLSLPVYTGGRIEGEVTAAKEERAAAAKDVEGGTADLLLETTFAYWSLVSARENARVLGEAVASFEAHLRDAMNRRELGLAASNEVLAVQVERDRAELARLVAAHAAEVANADLVRLVGLPPLARVEPSEPLATVVSADEDVERLTAEAAQRRPEIAALRSRVAALEASARATRAATLPQVSLAAGYEYANPNTRVLPLAAEWRGTWSASASVSFTALDGGRTSAAAARRRLQAEATRHQLEDVVQRVRLEVISRALDVGTARATIEVAERNLVAAAENLRVSRDRYKEGLIPSSELLDAETALLRAGLDGTGAATQLRVAAASLDRALGK